MSPSGANGLTQRLAVADCVFIPKEALQIHNHFACTYVVSGHFHERTTDVFLISSDIDWVTVRTTRYVSKRRKRVPVAEIHAARDPTEQLGVSATLP